MARQTGVETGRETLSPRVLAAMAKVPREVFVPAYQKIHAYTTLKVRLCLISKSYSTLAIYHPVDSKHRLKCIASCSDWG